MVFEAFRHVPLPRETWLDGGSFTQDLKEMALDGPLVMIRIRISGRATATGGGTLAGLTLESPLPLIANITIEATFPGLDSAIEIYNGPPVDLYWLISHLSGVRFPINAPTPVASGTGNFYATFEIPLRFDRYKNLPIYIDSRWATNLSMRMTYGADSDYAATNLSDIDVTTVDISIVEQTAGAPDIAAPHFIPRFGRQVMKIDQQSQELPSPGIAGGLVPFIQYRVKDASATGNSQRSDTIVRKIRLKHRGATRSTKWWSDLLDDTRKMYPMAGSGSGPSAMQPAGIAIFDVERHSRRASFIDARQLPIYHEIDTESALQQHLTAIAPASGDQLIMTTPLLVPNAAMAEQIARVA